MKYQEEIDLIKCLISKELELEYEYTITNDYNKDYIERLLKAEKYIYSINRSCPTFVKNMILQDDYKKYLYDNGKEDRV